MEEAAEILGVDRGTVAGMISCGQIAWCRFGDELRLPRQAVVEHRLRSDGWVPAQEAR
jgi:excisionase family DNA binding protein